MHVRPFWSGSLALFALLVSSADAGLLPSNYRSARGTAVVINEVQYDPAPTGREQEYEWIELLNMGGTAVSLAGWVVADNRSSDVLPDFTLAPGGYVVLAGGEGFGELYPGFSGRLITLEGGVGNGLGNGGDQVRLCDESGGLADAMSYGDDAGAFDPSAPLVAPGHSLERVPAGVDTDTADDWLEQPEPSPGEPAALKRPTATPTPHPPATLPAGGGPVLNEFLPAPRDVDWDGDGEADANDEWVEVYNRGDAVLALRGWQLDDVADGGSSPFVFDESASLPPRGYLLVFRRESRVALNNTGDTVRLLGPDGSVVDQASFSRSQPDASYSRARDGVGAWTDSLPPSPGRPNAQGSTPTGQSPSPTPGPGEGSPTSTPNPGAADAAYLPFLVTEVLFDPEPTGNDAAYEWVEIHNRSTEAVSLAGWALGDAQTWDRLADVDVAGGSYVVVAASAEAVSARGGKAVRVLTIEDGRIGSGLSNQGDVVRIRGPTGEIADAVSYGANLDAFDPAVPLVPPGSSIERLPSALDTDTAEDWWAQPAPSPGRAGERHEGPPRVVLNEILPAPRDVDWDGDGAATHTDEWVEIFNSADYGVDLAGWRLIRGEPEAWRFDFAERWTIEGGGFRVLHRRESDLSLGNEAGVLRLVRDDSVTADRFEWSKSPGYDRSWSRTVDGSGVWTADYAVTPGEPNHAILEELGASGENSDNDEGRDESEGAEYLAVSVSQAREFPEGTLVELRGWITASPGVFGNRVAYLADETAGIRLYLRRRGALPALLVGERVGARGVLAQYHGERQLVVERPTYVWSEGPGGRPVPLAIGTGDAGEPVEGALVEVRGEVVRFGGSSLWLDDGSGEVRVAFLESTGVRRPWVELGEPRTVVGIVGQYAKSSPWEGGYRVIPRSAEDLAAPDNAAPERLPASGGGGAAR